MSKRSWQAAGRRPRTPDSPPLAGAATPARIRCPPRRLRGLARLSAPDNCRLAPYAVQGAVAHVHPQSVGIIQLLQVRVQQASASPPPPGLAASSPYRSPPLPTVHSLSRSLTLYLTEEFGVSDLRAGFFYGCVGGGGCVFLWCAVQQAGRRELRHCSGLHATTVQVAAAGLAPPGPTFLQNRRLPRCCHGRLPAGCGARC